MKFIDDRRIEVMKEIIKKFMIGKDIDWSDVETAFSIASDLAHEYETHMLSHQ